MSAKNISGKYIQVDFPIPPGVLDIGPLAPDAIFVASDAKLNMSMTSISLF